MANNVTAPQAADNASWTKTNITVSANAIAAPDGTTTADKLQETTASAVHGLGLASAVSVGGTTRWRNWTFIKAAERSRICFEVDESTSFSGGVFATFNLSGSGTVVGGTNTGTYGSGFVLVSTSIQALANGWYYCSLVFDTTVGSIVPTYYLDSATGPSNNIVLSYAGTTGNGLHVWEMGLAPDATADNYDSLLSSAPSGSLATTDRPDATAINALLAVQGALATTDRPDAASISALLAVQASLATTDRPDAASLAATVANLAALATTDLPDVVAANALLAVQGALATTDRPDVAALSLLPGNTASLATTDRPDASSVASTIANQAALATTDRPDAAAGAVTVLVAATAALATTDRPDAATLVASTVTPGSPAITVRLVDSAGVLQATYGVNLHTVQPSTAEDLPDSGSFLGTVADKEAPQSTIGVVTVRLLDSAGTLKAIYPVYIQHSSAGTIADRPDVASISATLGSQAALATTDRPDSALIIALLGVQGVLDVTDRPDAAALAATAANQASLATTDRPDAAAVTGDVLSAGSAALATTDLPDVAAFTASLGVVAALSTTDRPDTGAFTASAGVTVALSTTDRPDAASLTVSQPANAALATTDPPDQAAISGIITVPLPEFPVVMAAIDRPDSFHGAYFTYPWHKKPKKGGKWTDVREPVSSWEPARRPWEEEGVE